MDQNMILFWKCDVIYKIVPFRGEVHQSIRVKDPLRFRLTVITLIPQ